FHIVKASEFAALAHREQLRKGGNQIPYISHPEAVGMILTRYNFTTETILAGILHDTVEDTNTSKEDLIQHFGEKVASIVLEVSEDKQLPFDERKSKYLEHLKTASHDAKAVSCADLIANNASTLISVENGQPIENIWKAGPAKTFLFYQ